MSNLDNNFNQTTKQPTVKLRRHTPIANQLLLAMAGIIRNPNVDGKRIYEDTKLEIPQHFLQFNWTKSSIKQLLLYAATCDSHGDVYYISRRLAATTINVNERTIRENERLFEDAGIITRKRCYSDYVAVKLVNYETDILALAHQTNLSNIDSDDKLDADEQLRLDTSKGGYTSLNTNILTELFALDCVNALRLALRTLAKVEKEVNFKNELEAFTSYSEYQAFAPKYISYRAAFKKLTMKISNIFDVNVLEKSTLNNEIDTALPTKKYKEIVQNGGLAMTATLYGKFDSKLQKKDEAIAVMRDFTSFQQGLKIHIVDVDKKVKLSNKTLENFAWEYSPKTVQFAFNFIKEQINSLSNVNISEYTSFLSDLTTDTGKMLRFYCDRFKGTATTILV